MTELDTELERQEINLSLRLGSLFHVFLFQVVYECHQLKSLTSAVVLLLHCIRDWMVLCCPHQLTAFFVLTQRRISVRHSQVNHNWSRDSFSDLRKAELSSVMSGSERLLFIRGSKNIFIVLLVPCSSSNMQVTKSQKLRRAGCVGFRDCPGILAHGGDKGGGEIKGIFLHTSTEWVL